MEIKLNKTDTEVILSNEMLDNDNFVDLIIGNVEVTVPLVELYCAVNAFLENKQQNRELLDD